MNTQTMIRVLFWLMLGTILAISIMPAGDAPTVFANDKLNHVLAFLTLALMARLLWSRTHAAVLFFMLMIFGGGIELLQLAMRVGRDADWMDFAADLVAVGLGLWVGKLIQSRKSRRPAAD